jgi:mannose-6-phosphate isomerase-like protein (cupin superfamily)
MSLFTIKNLREVEDSAPKHGFGEVQEARFAQRDLGAERTGLSLHRVKPGKRQGFAHRHDEAEEVYVVLAGAGRMKVGDDVIEVGPLDAIRVAPTAVRAFEGGPDGLEVLAFGPHHPGDGAIVPADWD